MKKLTAIILLLGVTSCGYNAINNKGYVIITDIESGYDGGSGQATKGCYYYVDGHTHHRMTQKAYFYDDCGKFTVGDTIKIVKR